MRRRTMVRLLPPSSRSLGEEEEEVGFEVSSLPSVSAISDNLSSGSSSHDASLDFEDCPFDEAQELSMASLDNSAGPSSRSPAEDPPLPAALPQFRPNSWSRPPRSPKSDSARALCYNFEKKELTCMPFLPDLMDMVACPCCHQGLDEESETPSAKSSRTIDPSTNNARDISLLSAAESVEEAEKQAEKLNNDLATTGMSAEGISYQIKRVLVEGLLYKKGSGKDWIKSRSWKGRWTRLALGWVEGYGDILVPLLCISWFPTSKSISTVIVLDSTVVLALDLAEKEHRFRFEIRHATTKQNFSLPVTRIFAAPSQKARDAWVFAISEALLSYSKEKAKRRSKKFPRMTSFRPEHVGSKSSSGCDDVFPPESRFTTVEGNCHIGSCQPNSPPLSPPVLRTRITFANIAAANPPRPKRPISPASPTAPAVNMLDPKKRDEAPRLPRRSAEILPEPVLPTL